MLNYLVTHLSSTISKRLYLPVRSLSNFSKMEAGKIAVCQMTSTNDKIKNLASFKRLVDKAATENAKLVFFPEATDYIGESMDETLRMAENLDGDLMSEYKNVAKEKSLWISIGGFHEKFEMENNEVKLYNSHVIINDKGEIQRIYRKLHLFNVCIPEKQLNLQESKYVVQGKELSQPVTTPVGSVGLSICYDMRFPEISTLLRKMGANILTYPSAFTVTTGKAHWETILRARAIENQCYVVAAAQYGKHNMKRSSYGNSVIINPWGEIIASCPIYDEVTDTNESITYANIDSELIQKIRSEMPVVDHRRNDIYDLKLIADHRTAIDDTKYKFSKIDIPSSTVFYKSKYSFAFTNIRCVVPGHVLVSSLRVVPRLENLTEHERNDFFETVSKVQKVMEMRYATNSSTICIQDGANAGQTVSHVHCHILPRKPNDFENNDDIYSELAKHDRDDNIKRDVKEQTEEAMNLRKFF